MNSQLYLPVEKMPKHWLNIVPFMKTKPGPLLLPNGKPAPPEVAMAVFPQDCVMQEVSQEPLIEIPKFLRERYVLANRPTPMRRALNLEKALNMEGDDIKIYYKREDVSPTGSHKGNTATAQAYYAKKQGLKGLVTETGAGQWGAALSFGCNIVGISCLVYQARISFQQKPGRVVLMNSYGSKVIPSPSPETEVGKTYYDKDNNHPGSLGIAISEAVEHNLKDPDIRYSLGSVVNFVLLHQTIIGQEAKIQMEMFGDYPDVVIGSIGGGSNFSGLALPFMKDKLEGTKPNTEFIGTEPSACPSLTRGKFVYDFGDSGGKAPITKMYTLGHNFVPKPIHAGGLRYHGSAPIVSCLTHDGFMRTEEYHQIPVLESGVLFTKTEGILPAPETAHAVHGAILAAKKAKENNEKKVILFNFSGHGYFDYLAYDYLHKGKLVNYSLPQEDIEANLNDPAMPQFTEPDFS
ncbi:MAG: TrpB-like pyridoxal phosphate-dependent enzyme [archaeon]|nr:TrpB-like pyridoxal phosphate-dependent enzyme [archaeon]